MHSLVRSNATRQLRSPVQRTLTVCVVDPQADDYLNWDSLAQADKVRLQFVATAEDALRLAHATAVDLWVINTELPKISGLELCSMLRDRAARTAMYLVADRYSPATERAAWAAGATLFGCKPEHEVWLDEWLQLQMHSC